LRIVGALVGVCVGPPQEAGNRKYDQYQAAKQDSSRFFGGIGRRLTLGLLAGLLLFLLFVF
jgi:hypothetical protein